MRLKSVILILYLALLFCFCNSSFQTAFSEKENIKFKVDSIIELMTLEEKIGQLNQYSIGKEMTGPNQSSEYAKGRYADLINGRVGSVLNLTGAENTRLVQQQVLENSRLKIPLLFAYDVIHGYKTIFPIPLAESCSWDLNLMEQTARASSVEASASGLHWTFAPMVDISRDPRWGRVMEGAGEDPFLGALVAEARIKGFQGAHLEDSSTIAACAKHFAGYGFAEAGKDYNSVNIGQNTLLNVVLPPFKKAATCSVATFMNAFNDLDGIPCTANEYLVQSVLKSKWKYDGVVVSDWSSIAELVKHRYAKNLLDAAEKALLAGCDIDMESKAYIVHLEELIEKEPALLKLIDESVRRVLKLKFKLGLFDDPFLYSNKRREENILSSNLFDELATEAASKSIVLLKNENSLLPISSDKKIALIGPLADDSDAPIGNWRAKGKESSAISLLEGLKNNCDTKNLFYAKGCNLSIGPNNFFQELSINNSDTSGFSSAIEIASNCDVVIMALGEPAFMSGEGRSRSNLDLPGIQKQLLKKIYEVNPNVVLVLMNGRPLTIEWESDNIPSILETWHCGTMAGEAIARILFGKENPSGKLTMTFPRNVGQIPIFYNKKSTGRPSSNPGQVFYSHHTDVSNLPLYPFGHGLSYTDFTYSDLTISSNEMNSLDTLSVGVTIENSGTVVGDEIVQLYISDLFSSVTPPEIALKGFKRITLAPGEQKKVVFNIHIKHLGFYDSQNKFVVEPGEFDVLIGPSSAELIKERFKLIN